VQAPTLILEGAGDIEVTPERARALYDDLGSRRKVFALIECASHFAPVETQYRALQGLALSWLTQDRAAGQRRGVVRVSRR
jgi:esterase/lipase